MKLSLLITAPAGFMRYRRRVTQEAELPSKILRFKSESASKPAFAKVERSKSSLDGYDGALCNVIFVCVRKRCGNVFFHQGR